MKRSYILFTVVIISAIMLAGCGLPSVQMVTQPTPAAQPLQTEGAAAQDKTGPDLQATIVALQTQVAKVPVTAANVPAAKVVENDAQVPAATAIPAAIVAPTAVVVAPTAVIPTAALAPTQTPQVVGGVPVVLITPIAPLQYPYYTQPYPYYTQANPNYPYYPQADPNYPYVNPYYPYPNTFVPCNRATFIADITVADNTNFAQGANFTKTWRLRNDGTCTWSTAYSLVFDHSDALGGAASVSLPTSVAPGSTVDVSVNLVAPSANGIYQGFWKLQDASSNRFGIGFDASVAFWVKISVGVPVYSYQAPYYPYPYYPAYSYPYNPPVPAYNPGYATGGCQLVSITPSNGATFPTNDDMDVKWTIKNTGSSTWTSAAVDYEYLGGTKMYKHNAVYDLPSDVASGSQVNITVDMVTPGTAGWYTTTWGLDQSGIRLCTMSATIYVK